MELNIITRFNLKWRKINNYEKWLSDRIDLFETYLAKSLSNQKDKKFKLILLVNEGTKADVISKLESIFKKNNFKGEILICKDVHDAKKVVVDRYKGKVCMLSRIDSDDVVSPNYVSNIRKFFSDKNNHNKILDFKNLYYYNTKNKELIDVIYPRPSMFISMMSNIASPYNFSHDLIDKKTGRKVVKLDSKDVCCVCHGGNLANDVEKSKKRFKYQKSNFKIQRWFS
jgi:hypothetical protein